MLVYLFVFTCLTPAASEWSSGQFNDAVDSTWQNDTSLYSVCPKVDHCHCYNSGQSDVIADCHDPELDFVPQGNYGNKRKVTIQDIVMNCRDF